MAAQGAFGGQNLDRLLKRLDPNQPRAWEKYLEIHRALVKFFGWNRAPRAEELADETIRRVAAKLETEEIENVLAFARGVARFVLLEEAKKNRRESPIEELPAGAGSLVDSPDPEREIVERIDQQIRQTCLQECRSRLRPADSVFVVAYYSADGEKQKVHRQRLAETEGMTMPALRTRANRVREKLEQCVIACLEGRRRAFAMAYSRHRAESG